MSYMLSLHNFINQLNHVVANYSFNIQIIDLARHMIDCMVINAIFNSISVILG